MAIKGQEQAAKVEAIIAPAIEAMGYELVRVLIAGGQSVTMQVMAERPDGKAMTVDDCADISRTVSALLEVEDPITGPYRLEVSSPGIDRPLVKARDFERFAGHRVQIEAGEMIAQVRGGIERLRQPPVLGAAAGVWYQGKALEFMAQFFFVAADDLGKTGARQQEVSRQRVERAIEILGQRLTQPPGLEELGRELGCSPYYLSRTFSREMGMTIPQYLRQIRMERAAELLKSGKSNVTEAALEVGYNSQSHFSQAFHEMHGCCPGLYPLRTSTQQKQ